MFNQLIALVRASLSLYKVIVLFKLAKTPGVVDGMMTVTLMVAAFAAFLASRFFHRGENGLTVGVALVGKTGTLRPLTHFHGVCRV